MTSTSEDVALAAYVERYAVTKRKRSVLRDAKNTLTPAAYAALLERLYR